MTTKTLRISHDNIEDIIAQYLYAFGIINDDEEVEYIDLGLDVDDDGMVEVELKVAD